MGVAAVPGSGKTATLSYLAAQLLAETELEDGSQRRDAPVVWSSSNPQVAAISPDGTLLAHSRGQATVRADLSPLSAEIEVTVDG